ncbi:hypothetical protein [Sphingomonas sp.]|jgi:hypothetical protein|uniref:hypothetical protein n=1 Tax=Sphingomonas sp. TaxID=28214 RepID=UPI002E34D32F|nr:hypothetical protein [Sphingomonas sp.]HEX4694532.1 hypothetical protein [Sphingomonas sp.]
MISLLALFLQAIAAPAPVAPWTVTNRTSTDGTIHTTLASVPSSDGNARLVMKCDAGTEKVVSVQFFTRTALGGPPDRPVTLTIDGGTPLGANWEFVEKGAFIREDIGVTTLAAAIASAKTINVHTTTAAGEPIDASFAGPTSPAPVTAVLAACDYTLGTVPVRAKPAPKK